MSSILPNPTISIYPIPVWRPGWTLAMNIICCQSRTLSSVPYFSNVPASSAIPDAIIAISVIGTTIEIPPLHLEIFIDSVFEQSMSSSIVILTYKSNSYSATACSCKKKPVAQWAKTWKKIPISNVWFGCLHNYLKD